MEPFTANQVAEAFVAFCNEHGDLLTNLKLQKLLYYAQGWHLGLYGAPLFDDEIQAWVNGPVVPSVYHRFATFGHRPIDLNTDLAAFPGRLVEHVADVWQAYGPLTGYDLERISYDERPWRAARRDLPPDAPSQTPIAVEDMKASFSLQSVNG